MKKTLSALALIAPSVLASENICDRQIPLNRTNLITQEQQTLSNNIWTTISEYELETTKAESKNSLAQRLFYQCGDLIIMTKIEGNRLYFYNILNQKT